MLRVRSVFFLVPVVGLVGACSTFDSSYDEGPVVVGGTQTGVTIRYDPAKTKTSEIDDVAISFCRVYDKKPTRRSKSELQPDVVYQAYDCVAPMAASKPAPAPVAPVEPEASPAQ